MTDKFTIRDILVYTLLGYITLFFLFLYYPFEIILIFEKSVNYSSLILLFYIPIFYLVGHVLMSIDDLLFNGLLAKVFPKEIPLQKKFYKYYNFIFFGYRNLGIRHNEEISNETFFKVCDKLIKKGLYDKPEYYQIMSDLFKGFFFIILSSIMFDIYLYRIEIWKIILLLLMWYRARIFSLYYVKFIKRNMNL